MSLRKPLSSLLGLREQTLRPSARRENDRVASAEKRLAFSQMAKRQESVLLRVARRLTGSSRGAEERGRDLVQETLVRAYEAFLRGQAPELDSVTVEQREGRERSWLIRIMTNHYINEYRRKQKWEAPVTVDDLTVSSSGMPAALHAAAADRPDSSLLSSTLDEAIEDALALLTEGQRVCIILVDIEGMEYADVAQLLNVPVGTVRSRLARARTQLQPVLTQYAREHRLL